MSTAEFTSLKKINFIRRIIALAVLLVVSFLLCTAEIVPFTTYMSDDTKASAELFLLAMQQSLEKGESGVTESEIKEFISEYEKYKFDRFGEEHRDVTFCYSAVDVFGAIPSAFDTYKVILKYDNILSLREKLITLLNDCDEAESESTKENYRKQIKEVEEEILERTNEFDAIDKVPIVREGRETGGLYIGIWFYDMIPGRFEMLEDNVTSENTDGNNVNITANSNAHAKIVLSIIKGIATAAVLVVFVIFAIVAVVTAIKSIIALIKMRKGIGNSENSGLSAVSAFLGGFVICILISPSVSDSNGFFAAILLVACAIICGLTHLFRYTPLERKFLITHNAAAIVAVVGCVMAMGVVLGGGLEEVILGNYPSTENFKNGGAIITSANGIVTEYWIAVGIMIFLALTYILTPVDLLCRDIAMCDRGSSKRETVFGTTLMIVVVTAIAYIAAIVLKLPEAFSEMIMKAVPGVAVAFAAGIAELVLRKTLCGKLSKEDALFVISGTPSSTVETAKDKNAKPASNPEPVAAAPIEAAYEETVVLPPEETVGVTEVLSSEETAVLQTEETVGMTEVLGGNDGSGMTEVLSSEDGSSKISQ